VILSNGKWFCFYPGFTLYSRVIYWCYRYYFIFKLKSNLIARHMGAAPYQAGHGPARRLSMSPPLEAPAAFGGDVIFFHSFPFQCHFALKTQLIEQKKTSYS